MKLLQVCENHVDHPVQLSFLIKDKAPFWMPQKWLWCCFTLYNSIGQWGESQLCFSGCGWPADKYGLAGLTSSSSTKQTPAAAEPSNAPKFTQISGWQTPKHWEFLCGCILVQDLSPGPLWWIKVFWRWQTTQMRQRWSFTVSSTQMKLIQALGCLRCDK